MIWASDQLAASEAFFRSLMETARRARIPLSGGIDLTARCNLDCVHCYIRERAGGSTEQAPRSVEPQTLAADGEMTTARLLRLLDEIADAGCLFLILTGGEPLLRRDFGTIYRHARERGIQVTVYTNGTLVSGAVVDLFRAHPPRLVEVTLYGATAATYERITRVPGSFERCVRGIGALLERGIRVGTKTILMTLNRHELTAMRELARRWGCPFRFGGDVFPTLSGDRSPLTYRLPPEIIIAEEMADASVRGAWARTAAMRVDRADAQTEKLYTCGAGRWGFHVTAQGALVPCIAARAPAHDLVRSSFDVGWREVMPRLEERKLPRTSPCSGCRWIRHCGRCPAKLGIESGDEAVPTPYHCELARLRECLTQQETHC